MWSSFWIKNKDSRVTSLSVSTVTLTNLQHFSGVFYIDFQWTSFVASIINFEQIWHAGLLPLFSIFKGFHILLFSGWIDDTYWVYNFLFRRTHLDILKDLAPQFFQTCFDSIPNWLIIWHDEASKTLSK